MVRRKKARATSKGEASKSKSTVEEEGATTEASKSKKDEEVSSTGKDKGEKRKIGSSQVSVADAIRGGKKRKK
jgi:hypothetical protein